MRRASRSERAQLLGRLAAGATTAGLCATCRHLELLESPRSVFVRCGLARSRLEFRRYPSLPVLDCSGWSEARPEDSVE